MNNREVSAVLQPRDFVMLPRERTATSEGIRGRVSNLDILNGYIEVGIVNRFQSQYGKLKDMSCVCEELEHCPEHDPVGYVLYVYNTTVDAVCSCIGRNIGELYVETLLGIPSDDSDDTDIGWYFDHSGNERYCQIHRDLKATREFEHWLLPHTEERCEKTGCEDTDVIGTDEGNRYLLEWIDTLPTALIQIIGYSVLRNMAGVSVLGHKMNVDIWHPDGLMGV